MRAPVVAPERCRAKALTGLTAIIVVAYYFFFTAKSLGIFFDRDDMMNLYTAWTKPVSEILLANLLYWTDSARPLGELWYRAMFAVAGFHPQPFRVALLALGLVNIALFAWFVKLLSDSPRIIAFAAVLFAFHTRLMEVWFRTAVIYDVLCFTFFYMAMCLYISQRRRDQYPGIWRSLAITASFIAALDAKEMAVALPVALLLYELLLRDFRWRNTLLPGFLSLLALPYIAMKTLGAHALTSNPWYQQEYTLSRFVERWSEYLGYLFVQPLQVSPRAVAALLLGPLLLAGILRSRHLLFAWGLLFVTTLPVAFLPSRGGFVLYISWAGWVLYAAVLADRFLSAAVRNPHHQTLATAAVFILLGWRFGKLNLHDQRLGNRDWLYGDARDVERFAAQNFPHEGRLLFLDDGFGTDEWTPLFILRLQSKTATLVVDRAKMMRPKPATQDGYQYVFTYENGVYRRLKP